MTCYYYSFARVGVDDYLKALVIKFEMPGSKSYTLPYNYNFFLDFPKFISAAAILNIDSQMVALHRFNQ